MSRPPPTPLAMRFIAASQALRYPEAEIFQAIYIDGKQEDGIRRQLGMTETEFAVRKSGLLRTLAAAVH